MPRTRPTTRRRTVLVLAVTAAALVAGSGHRADAVVGGGSVPEGAYPFMAAIASGGSQFCGGSVVASTWVLTAAHCVPDGDASGLSVRVGSNDWTRGRDVVVTQVVVHPGYDDGTSANDAALLRLAAPAGVPAIRLAGAGDDGLEAAGTRVVVAGWGSEVPIVGLVPPLGTSMKQATLDVVADVDCGSITDAATQLCAEALLADSCQGDSGGPLFATTGGGPVQIGVVSYGTGCAIPGFAGVYSEVNSASIRGFISSTAGV